MINILSKQLKETFGEKRAFYFQKNTFESILNTAQFRSNTCTPTFCDTCMRNNCFLGFSYLKRVIYLKKEENTRAS